MPLKLKKTALTLALLTCSATLNASNQELPTSNENNVYKQPTAGQKTLLMMLETSSAMDDFGEGSEPKRSIADDYPSCQGKSLKWLDYDTLNRWYPMQRLTNGIEKSTFALQLPYCNIGDMTNPTIDTAALSRMDRMKTAMSNLLGDDKIDKNTVMGLGQFPTHSSSGYKVDINKTPQENKVPVEKYFSPYADSNNFGHTMGNDISAKIVVPAKALDGDQRYIERVAVTAMESGGKAPLASALAEAGAYLLGKTTLDTGGQSPGGEKTFNGWGEKANNTYGPYTYSGFNDSAIEAKENNNYKTPIQDNEKCNTNGIFLVTNGVASETPRDIAKQLMENALDDDKEGFTCDIPSTEDIKANLDNLDHTDYGWTCMAKFAQKLANSTKHQKIRVAVAGFGKNFVPFLTAGMFEDVTKNDKTYRVYKCNALQADYDYKYTPFGTNTEQIYRIKREELQDIKNACLLGNFDGEYGKGGFYPALSEYHFTTAVNEFIQSLDDKIPSIGVATPSVPTDTLNPTKQLSLAFSPEYEPNNNQKMGIWLGNVKKYIVKDSIYYSQDSQKTFDQNGVLTDSKDFWNKSNQNDGGNVLIGGMLSQLPVQSQPARHVYINTTENNLQHLDKDNLAKSYNIKDKYLLNLLGYAVTPTDEPIDNVDQASQLRQMGASLHSTPVFFTTQANIKADGTYENRKDYILLGTVQGLLQVVDAETGIEVFSYLPKEMADQQYKGFVSKGANTSEKEKHYDGIDAPWTIYTHYISDVTGHVKADKLNAYGGMRRSGKSYYGLTLSNFSDDNIVPQQLFQTETDANKVTESWQKTAISRLGQSWSKPVIGKIKWKGKPQLVMIVGGGYDENYNDPNFTGEITLGNGVYIYAAESQDDVNAGDLLWWTSSSASDTPNSKANLDLKYSVVSEIKALDRNGDGFIDNLYFGDLGGQLFRIDINNRQSTQQEYINVPHITRLANFQEPDKVAPKFYNMPRVTVYSKNNSDIVSGRFAVVSIGSGDVSSPTLFATNGITDKVYNIYDKDVGQINFYNSQPTVHDLTLSNLVSVYETQNKIKQASGWYDEITGTTYASANASVSRILDTHQTRYKLLNTFYAVKNILFTSYYDAADNGSSNDCDAGIQGRTYLKTYCLPYGKCSSLNHIYIDGAGTNMGVGIDPLIEGGYQSAGKNIIGPIKKLDGDVEKFLQHEVKSIFKSVDWYEE